MKQNVQWEIMLKSNHYPCLVADADTYEICYANSEYVKIAGVSDVIGQKFFEVIENDHFVDFDEMRLNWLQCPVVQIQLENRRMNVRFDVTLTLFPEFNAIFLILEPTEESKQFISNFEEAMSRCMEISAQTSETILPSYMELLCQYYGSEAAYVYRFGEKDSTIRCVAQWSIATNIQAVDEVSTVMNAGEVISWIQAESTPLLMIGEVKDNSEKLLHPVMIKLLDVFQLNNLTMCKVEDGDGKIVGIVGLSNPTSTDYFDHRLLSTIARFVAQKVTKEFVNATLFQMHHRDLLTGLYNRGGYARRIEKMKGAPPRSLGVISVNINGLKTVNNNLGNEHGDAHIQKSAQRIKSHFGYDMFRVSGDEFIALAEEVEKEEFEEKVSKLHEIMRQEGNFDFSMGSSWGTGNYDITVLLREADTFMYINKQEYYSSRTHEFETVSNVILRDLLYYLEEEEFMIYLQPQVKLVDGSLHGAEALIRRFDKKNKRMVFPDKFIALYEQNSVIRHIDLFVVDQVCKLLKEWELKGKAVPISVNLSRVTLQEYGIVKTIVNICNKYEISHELLVIEVTERVGLVENNVASSLVTEFMDNGFAISLDDFGCAYSNIITLAQIDVDEVKLDKSLVDDLTSNRKNHVLVKNVLSMCLELEGMSTLAEGIEDEEQANLLLKLGCNLGQGYFYSRPISVAEFNQRYIDTDLP